MRRRSSEVELKGRVFPRMGVQASIRALEMRWGLVEKVGGIFWVRSPGETMTAGGGESRNFDKDGREEE